MVISTKMMATMVTAERLKAADAMMRLYHDDLAKRLREADDAQDPGSEAAAPGG